MEANTGIVDIRSTQVERRMLALVGQLLSRVSTLDQRVQDLEEWLEELAGDMIDRTETEVTE
jgi:hypothetical protein